MLCPTKFLELLQDALPNRENFEDHFETALFVSLQPHVLHVRTQVDNLYMQNTMPEKEELPVTKAAYMFPWQVEQVPPPLRVT